MTRIATLICLTSFVLLFAPACGNDDGHQHHADAGDNADASVNAPTTYLFDSRFTPGTSSVSYPGQTFRHSLIWELNNYLAGLTDAVDTTPPADDATLAALNFYFDFDSGAGGTVALGLVTSPPLAQTDFDSVSSGKDLRSKLAGNDSATDHMVWNTPGNFKGWSEGGSDADTPTKLVQYWFGLVDDLAFQRLTTPQLDPDGSPIGEVFVTAKGQDLRQLVQKFLLVAITFQQGLDDYMDNATADKGLMSSNLQDGDNAYSKLGHAWDEGFGYFGAARDYNDYTDDELSSKGGRDDYQGYHDSDGNGAIDLLSEYNFGLALNCAKRDLGSDASAKTDYSKAAFDAFLAGRHLIASVDGELSADQMTDLVAQRDIIANTWERCLAATVVHYINEVLADMAAFDTKEYSFADHAKHWSELKGFALGFQFSPRSPMLESTRFADLHGYLRDQPVLANDAGGSSAIAAYVSDLQAARDLLKTAYGFADANVANW